VSPASSTSRQPAGTGPLHVARSGESVAVTRPFPSHSSSRALDPHITDRSSPFRSSRRRNYGSPLKPPWMGGEPKKSLCSTSRALSRSSESSPLCARTAPTSKSIGRYIEPRMFYHLIHGKISSQCVQRISIIASYLCAPYLFSSHLRPSVPGSPAQQWPPTPSTGTKSQWLRPLQSMRSSKPMARQPMSPSPMLSSKGPSVSLTQSSAISATSPTPSPSLPS